MSKTYVVAAFPGTGKSYLSQNPPEGMTVLDLDVIDYRSGLFPVNYVQAVKDNLGKYDIILVSTHLSVRKLLLAAGIKFILIFPGFYSKGEYRDRCRKKKDLLRDLEEHWTLWIRQCEDDKTTTRRARLIHDQYLSDILPRLLRHPHYGLWYNERGTKKSE